MKKSKQIAQQEKMFSLISESQTSAFTNSEFCRQKNISSSLYYYWKKRYNDYHKSTSDFASVQLRTPKEKEDRIEIKYPNGVSLYLSLTLPPSLFKSFINL